VFTARYGARLQIKYRLHSVLASVQHCVLPEELLSFIASHISYKMTVNPCNKLLLL